MERPEAVSAQQVGRYYLVERLAVGGMAEVFLACEHNQGSRVAGSVGESKDAAGTDRLVVLKRILPHLAENPEFVDAFAREARIAARIHHPNVVEIHELGEAAGLLFITMEYLPGTTLKELMASARAADGIMPIGVALHLLGQAIDGAHAAHEVTDASGRPYGLVHRDITPHNLMVDDQAQVKLLDFGIAKTLRTDGTSEGFDQTRTGVLKGKIAYMSPEQCRQDKLDRRADVFSLGVVGYQLLTGRKPFQQSSELATMQAIILGKHPALREVREEVPELVAAEIEKALASEPEHRHPTARALREALFGAAAKTGVKIDRDEAVAWVQRYLGPAIANRRRALDQALARTLDSFEDLRLDTESLERAHLSDHGRTPVPVVSSRTGRPAPPRSARTPVTPPSARGRWAAGGLAVALLSMVAALGWVGTRQPPVPFGPPVRIELAPVADPDELLRDLEPIRAYLERTLHRPMTLHVSDSYRDAAEAVVSGQVQLGLLPANTVSHARAEDPHLAVLGVQVVDGSTSTDAYLVVRRDDPAQSVHDLVGRTICWVDPLSNTGYALPRKYLLDRGIDPEQAVVAHLSGNHEQVLRDVLAGRCDAGATYSGNWVTADSRGIRTAQLRILAITGSSPHDAMVAGSGQDPRMVEAVRTALLAYDRSADASPSTGTGPPISGFVRPPPDYALPTH